MNTPAVTVFDNGGKTWDRYTVIISGDVYTMSADADSPSGFNQWAGLLIELPNAIDKRDKEIALTDLPRSTQRAIGNRLKAYLE